MGANFVAAWKKVGTFRIVKGGDAARNLPRDLKVGGNVAAYFCTPDLRVVNGVLGNVRPETFLAEARRAVEMRVLDPEAASRAHAAVPYPVRWSYNPEAAPSHALHQSLAAGPLPKLEDVFRKFFEEVLHETVSDRDVEVVDGLDLRRASRRDR